jgi:hypothetical protein
LSDFNDNYPLRYEIFQITDFPGVFVIAEVLVSC